MKLEFKNPYVDKYFDMLEDLQKLPSIVLGEPKKGICLMTDKRRKELRKKRKKR